MITKIVYAVKLLFKFAAPNETVESIIDIDFDKLKSKGIRFVISDIDQTIVPQSSNEISQSVLSKIDEIRLLLGDSAICLLTNEPTPQRAKLFESRYSLVVVDTKGIEKPLPGAFNAARRCVPTSTRPEEICFIGDRLLTDIVGSNNVGMYSIMVSPFSKESDRVITKILRVIESSVLKLLLYRKH